MCACGCRYSWVDQSLKLLNLDQSTGLARPQVATQEIGRNFWSLSVPYPEGKSSDGAGSMGTVEHTSEAMLDSMDLPVSSHGRFGQEALPPFHLEQLRTSYEAIVAYLEPYDGMFCSSES